ncbi:MAG: hypothetical protein FWE73_09725 [Candidatus Bathyarchaeota archaeon]|nr:hypothetical protein [Candidatus Termitimicrobium sp.]
MKIEKKLVALSILAIAIGIATVTPMAILMNANAQTSQPYGESIQVYGEPWLDLEITGAYFTIDLANGEILNTEYIRTHEISYQTTLNDNALSHQPKARMEYFEATFYADNIELLKQPFSVIMTDFSSGSFPTELFGFFNEYLFNCSAPAFNSTNGTPHDICEMTSSRCCGRSGATDIDEYEAFLEVQTVHLEIKYIGSVSFDGNNTVVSFANDQNIQHIELTKNKGGNTGFGLNSFGFGSRYSSGK